MQDSLGGSQQSEAEGQNPLPRPVPTLLGMQLGRGLVKQELVPKGLTGIEWVDFNLPGLCCGTRVDQWLPGGKVHSP